MARSLILIFFLTAGIFSFPNSLRSYWDEDIPLSTRDERYTNADMDRLVSRESSVIRLPALVLLRLYQSTLSGKTGSKCIFYPSCSRFSFYSVQKHGLVEGVLMSGDRLNRCNAFADGSLYFMDLDSGLYLDPIENHDLMHKR